VTSDQPPGRTTRLVLPVRELEATVPGAAIVLLDPFLDEAAVEPGVVDELGEFFAGLTPFAYVLGEPAEFPHGGRYLPPQPVGVLRRIGHSLRHTFPEVAGQAIPLGSAVPHLDLPDGLDVPTPLEVHAREALLLVGDPATTLATFRFGTSAA
jgi:hypothetical protein